MADRDTCFEVFKSHWQQAWFHINSCNGSARPQEDFMNTVLHYTDQMMLLLVEESDWEGSQGPILQYVLEEDVIGKLVNWITTVPLEHTDRLKFHHLKMFDMLISQSQQPLLLHKPVLRPLLDLLSVCKSSNSEHIEQHLVLVLHQLCIAVTRQTELLELLFNARLDHGSTKFVVFSLLIPFIHREGTVGQQARDALLLIMSLSAKSDQIGKYIAENSDFCPVLATGLSGLYSSLPRKVDPPYDDWHQIQQDDINKSKEIVMFLNSLEFCNAVVQGAHPEVGQQLQAYIYHGFLLSVMGPALHQSSVEEIIAATAYLDLCVRSISEPSLLYVFIRFIILEKFDDLNILDSLINRIHSSSRLCMVTLSLFRTLLDLNCEDVMFQLVFKYLIPCNHVMLSQRRSVSDLDMHSKAAEKLLALRPSCCVQMYSQEHHVGINNSYRNEPSSPSVLPCVEVSDSSYKDYLSAAQVQIERCAWATRVWSAPYDGENPPQDSMNNHYLDKKNHQSGTDSRNSNEQSISKDSDQSVHDISQKDQLESAADAMDQSTNEIAQNDQSSQASQKKQSAVENSGCCSQMDQSGAEDSGCVLSMKDESSLETEQFKDNGMEIVNDNSPSMEENNNSNSCSDNPASLTQSQLAELGSFLLTLKNMDVPSESDYSLDECLSQINELCAQLLSSYSQHRPDTSSFSISLSSSFSSSLNLSPWTPSHEDKSKVPRDLPSLSLKPVMTKPNIGPFLGSLLQKLDQMMINSLYVNLLLTDVVSRLACYPQPLIRSFLLNHTLVFQPTIRSLMQVLSSVKHKVDSYSYTVKNFSDMLIKARHFLSWRDEIVLYGLDRRLSVSSQSSTASTDTPVTQKAKRKSFGDFIRRGFSNKKKPPPQQRLQLNTSGAHYMNRLPSPVDEAEDPVASLKTKNAVYCALVLDEFIKELAAISQEHSAHYNMVEHYRYS